MKDRPLARLWKRWMRPALFNLDAEKAHNLTLRLLGLANALPPLQALLRGAFSLTDPGPKVHVMGLEFPNPLGLAAGYDKNGVAITGLSCLGFGHLELGTVTPLPQEGNPTPRIFRLPEDQALINRMGFPNAGAAALLRRLRRARSRTAVIGINIGKGAATPLEGAYEDYLALLETFWPHADYLAVNVSSPNTIGLRRLQARGYLESLLAKMVDVAVRLEQSSRRKVPIMVKIAPDLSEQELEDAIGAMVDAGIAGVIACNTTVDRGGLRSERREEQGGLSGAPLQEASTLAIQRIHRMTHGRLPIIGVGGIMNPEGAIEKLDAGASLVQIYTGLIYRGPGLIREILEGLSAHSR